jgi:hypothetical protein
MKVKINDAKAFLSSVFGADCFLQYFPALLTTGVVVEKMPNGFFYIMQDGLNANDTAFFSEEEMNLLSAVE